MRSLPTLDPYVFLVKNRSLFSNPVQYLPINPVHTLKLSAAEELKLCSISSSMKNASREMISADVFSDLKVFSSSFLVLQERIWPCNVKMKRRRQFLFSSRPIWGKRWGRVHWHQRFISYPSVFSSTWCYGQNDPKPERPKKSDLLPGAEWSGKNFGTQIFFPTQGFPYYKILKNF